LKILLVRLSAIGDIVMASPLPGAIKRIHPNAQITWLCQPECEGLLSHHPDVDQVIVWPKGEWRKLWKQGKFIQLGRKIRQLRKQLQSENFDLALDLQGLLKSGYLTWLSGAKKRIGLGASEGSQLLMHQVISRDGGDQDLIGSEYRFLADQLGYDTSNFEMNLGVSPSALESMKLLSQKSFGHAYFVICPFTTRPQKHWFDDYWQTTAAELKQKCGLPVVLLGGPADTDAANELCRGTEIIDLSGQTSLQEAAALIGLSQGLIGVDTGLTHMGHAMKVPTLALFGSTRPYLETGLVSSKVIYLALDCSPCRRNPTCDGRFDCLRQITPERVLGEFSLLLSDSP
jgi:heptosyltransferase I